jgi:hypothetical protein
LHTACTRQFGHDDWLTHENATCTEKKIYWSKIKLTLIDIKKVIKTKERLTDACCILFFGIPMPCANSALDHSRKEKVKINYGESGIWTHALSDQNLNLAP